MEERNSFMSIIPPLELPCLQYLLLHMIRNRGQFYVVDCSLEDHSSVNILDGSFKPVTIRFIYYSKAIFSPAFGNDEVP